MYFCIERWMNCVPENCNIQVYSENSLYCIVRCNIYLCFYFFSTNYYFTNGKAQGSYFFWLEGGACILYMITINNLAD